MTEHPPAPRGPLTRTIADLRGSDGPTLICTGGVHGNEPAGIHAAREVALELARQLAHRVAEAEQDALAAVVDARARVVERVHR